MKRIDFLIGGLIGAFTLSFSLSFIHPFGNPRATTDNKQAELLEHAMIPPEARAVLRQKCASCHSNSTVWPWYGRFAPVSWLLERDITEAHEKMNLSKWESMPESDLEVLKAKIVQESRSHDMPPLQYRIVHRDSAVTDDEVKSLTAWAKGIPDPTASAPPQPTQGDPGLGDATKGKSVFEARCTGCHSAAKNLEGPKLGGVFGRTSGTVPDFKYSAVLKKAAIKWDETSLDKWLTDPDVLVPGNDMEFHVAKPDERQNIVAYLRSLK